MSLPGRSRQPVRIEPLKAIRKNARTAITKYIEGWALKPARVLARAFCRNFRPFAERSTLDLNGKPIDQRTLEPEGPDESHPIDPYTPKSETRRQCDGEWCRSDRGSCMTSNESTERPDRVRHPNFQCSMDNLVERHLVISRAETLPIVMCFTVLGASQLLFPKVM